MNSMVSVSAPIDGIRKFIRQSGMVFKHRLHSLKKRNPTAFEQAQLDIDSLRKQALNGEIVLGIGITLDRETFSIHKILVVKILLIIDAALFI